MRRRLGTSIAAGLTLGLLLPQIPAARAAVRHEEKQIGEAADNAALVYFIREKKRQGSKSTYFVYADDAFIGALDNDCYIFGYVPPGERLLWLNFAHVTEQIALEPGEVYYFKLYADFENVGTDWGVGLLGRAGAFCTPDEEEIAKSKEHLAKRKGKAEKWAAKEPEDLYAGRYWYSREKSVGTWPHTDLAPYSALYIEDWALTDPKAHKRKKDLQVSSAGSRIADQVRRQLDDDLFTKVFREAPSLPVEGAVLLRGELTRYKPGSETARTFLAGTSNSHLDFRVRLIDGVTGDELASFSAQRVWAWGGTAGGTIGIDEMEESLAFEISVYLEECKTGIVKERPQG
jgi:hypothetical protein